MRLISGDKNKVGVIELISIHIPKTGGRSFHEVLKNVYGESLDKRYEKEHFFPKPGKSKKLSGDLPKGIRGIHGHLTISQVKHIIDAYQPKLITWVRHPVDRVISNYYYFMRRIREGDTPVKQRSKINYTLMEYASQPKRRNRMTMILNGMELKDFFFIGIMEQFEEDLKILSKMMDWPLNIEIPHINNSSSFKLNNDCATQYNDIDDAMRQEVGRLNQLDMQLYKEIIKMRKIS